MDERALMPDYLRLVALFGIVVVNVEVLAFPFEEGATDASLATAFDQIALWLVYGLALLKSYGLFSFMFGVGLAFQIASAERAGVGFGRRYRNRMIGLILLGLLHGVFFYLGDILLAYGLLGGLLYLMRNWPVRRLVWIGAALVVFQALIGPAATLLIPVEEGGASPLSAWEAEAWTSGSFLDVAALRGLLFAVVLPFGLLLQGFAAMGWFCLGLAAVRSGLIDQPDHPLWRKARRWCLVPGVALSLLAGAVAVWGDFYVGQGLVNLFAPLATVGYLGLIAAVSRPATGLLAHGLRIGGNSLTIYLGQSICLSFIFCGYGLGLWNTTGAGTAILIAIAVTLVLMAALGLWLSRFRTGPFEAALRWFTRLGDGPTRGAQSQPGVR